MVNHGLWSKQTMEQHGKPCSWFKKHGLTWSTMFLVLTNRGLTWSTMVWGQNKPWNNTINHGSG